MEQFFLLTRGPDGPALCPARNAFILATHLTPCTWGRDSGPTQHRCHQPCPADRSLLSSSALSRRPLAAVIIKGALRTVIALPLLIDLVTRGRVLVEGSHIGAVWCVRVECRVLVWPLSTFVIIDPCALECGTNT